MEEPQRYVLPLHHTTMDFLLSCVLIVGEKFEQEIYIPPYSAKGPTRSLEAGYLGSIRIRAPLNSCRESGYAGSINYQSVTNRDALDDCKTDM